MSFCFVYSAILEAPDYIYSPSPSWIVIVAEPPIEIRGLVISSVALKLMTSSFSTTLSSRIITLAHCLGELGGKVSTVVKVV